jgi:hypothetical protein
LKFTSEDAGRNPDTCVEQEVLQNIIRNAMIVRDEEEDFKLANEKEKTRSEVK